MTGEDGAEWRSIMEKSKLLKQTGVDMTVITGENACRLCNGRGYRGAYVTTAHSRRTLYLGTHRSMHACMRPVRVNEPLITVVISSVNQRLMRRVAPGLAAARSILSTAPVLYGMCAYNVCLCTHMSICASICLESSKILENRDVTLLC